MAVVALRRLWLLFVVVFYARSSVALSSLQVLFDSTNFLHRDLSYHVEQPARITACLVALQEGQLLDSHCDLVDIADIPIPVPGLKTASSTVRQEKCTLDELEYAKSILLQTHNPELVLQLERATREAQERRIQEGKVPLRHMGRIDPDTYVTTETYHVCLRATCAWIRACRTAMSRGMAMALTRPPGHHATINTSNGFCIFNFAAAAALHVLNDNPNRKVTVLDWDVHYGQGVADILQHHPNARYVSLHQVPAFPYMGEKRGVEGMYQNILNIPVPAESTWTCGYEEKFDSALEFVCTKGTWEPDVVIVSAGYDALDSDWLASVSLTTSDFGKMASKLWNRLSNHSRKRPAIVIGLEGGYQIEEGAAGGNLQQAVVETARALVQQTIPQQ